MQFTFHKTNGNMVTVSVTNNTTGATIATLAQSLVDLINSTPKLQSADGLIAADFFDYAPYGSTEAQFYLYARTSGWPASQILATLNTSPDLFATPGSWSPLEDNISDLRPRNHLYLSSGTNTLTVNFQFDTTQLPDGYHQLTAVAYEGTSVATQTRVTRTVLIQNTGLTATLSALPAGSNAALNGQLQFTVTANTNTISSIELFSTGGAVGVATGQATAMFTLSTTNMGLGLHPFYALITDQAGHRYQTETAWYRILLGVVAPNLAYTIAPGISQRITLAEIETNGLQSSLASPNYSVTGVSATSVAGGTVIYDANNILYAYPQSGNPATDSFSYTVTAGTYSATATVTLVFQKQSGAASGSISLSGGAVAVTLFGIPGIQYDVQRSTNLNTWTTLIASPPLSVSPPIMAGADGRISFSDNFLDLGGVPTTSFYRTIQH